MQGWGANLRKVTNGAPIDIDSDLIGITRPLSKYCDKNQYPNKGVVKSKRVNILLVKIVLLNKVEQPIPPGCIKI